MPQVTISGTQFDIPAPYSEGHTLNAAEASVLNQTFLENIRNNAAGRIKAAKEKMGESFSVDTPVGGEGEDASKTLRQLISDYANTYQFGVRTTRTAEPVDPVEREARVIAREVLAKALKEKGVKKADLPENTYEDALASYAANDKIVKEAKRRVKERESIGLDEIDLGIVVQGAGTEGQG